MKRTTAMPTPLEREECVTFVEYLENMKNLGKVILFTHIPTENNIRGGLYVGMQNKRLGVRKGFPDYCVVTKKGLLFVEMKRISESKVSMEQLAWIDALNDAGCKSMIAYGAAEAIEFVQENI